MPENSSTAIVPFRFDASRIAVLLLNGEAWFIADEVCAILGYSRGRNPLRMLDDDEVRAHIVSGKAGHRSVSIVSESGLYALILRSRNPVAKKFRKWVTSEVLPAIRRNGFYGSPPPDLALSAPARRRLLAVGVTKDISRVAAILRRARAKKALLQAEGKWEEYLRRHPGEW